MKRLIGCLLLMLGSAGAAGADSAALKAGVFDPARLAPDFSIRGSNGQDLKLSQYRGKVVLLSFGYTTCADVCPVTLAVLAQARRQLGAGGADVQVIYVTVDPERDDVARLRQYLAAFDASFMGGTGSATQLAAVRKDYGISATRIPAGDSYLMSHSSFVYLIDRGGRLRALMPFGHPARDYVHDLNLLLEQ
jgi:protein SCO1/2